MDFTAISNMLLEIFYIIIGIMMLNTAVFSLNVNTAVFNIIIPIIM